MSLLTEQYVIVLTCICFQNSCCFDMLISCKNLKGALQAVCCCLCQNLHVHAVAYSHSSQDATFVMLKPYANVLHHMCGHTACAHSCMTCHCIYPATLQTSSVSAWNGSRAQSHLEEVQPQGRAVDKAFKRELGPLPFYPDLLLLYQDRSRGYTYQADFRMGEVDDMMTAPTSLVPQQEQRRMQAPVLGYANPFPPPPAPPSICLSPSLCPFASNGLPLLWFACTVIGGLTVFAGGSCHAYICFSSKAQLEVAA